VGSKIKIGGATALVTGAGSGIGRATAIALAREGAKVLSVDIDEGRAKATADGCGGFAFSCDVVEREAVKELAERVSAEHGALGVLVNNAGVGMSGGLLEMADGDWEWIRGINLDGVVNCSRAFVPAMLEAGRGHVVNISSLLGYVPSAMTPAYCATKAAVLMLSRSVRADWGRHGVGVTAVCPGLINTSILEGTRFAGVPDPERARELAQRGFSRGHSPELVARSIIGAIKRNRAVVPVGAEAEMAWFLQRVLPLRVTSLMARPVPAFTERLLGR
jgi:2-hydroxycyclohexanecarboxyl-CoA dehydrogenase